MPSWFAAVFSSMLGGCTGAGPEPRAAEQEEALIDAMFALDAEATAIREAAVQGQWHEARALAGRLATRLSTSPSTGGGALPGPPAAAEELQLALAEISTAGDLEATAAGIGRMADACAACHLVEGVVPGSRPPAEVARHPRRAVGKEMARHGVAVDRLWLGITGPSDAELAAAMAVLAEGSLEVPTDERIHRLAQAVAAAPREARGRAYGELVAACAGCHLANGRPPSVPRIAGVALPRLQSEMEDHLFHALELQLSIMGGDLDAIHGAAGRLRDGVLAMPLPPEAAPWVDAIRAAAGRAEAAGSVEVAARAMADVGLACARCHVATGSGPTDAVEAPPTDNHMALHVYGAWWMGYGVIAPDEAAWVAGTAALATAALHPEDWRPPDGQEGLDQRIHALAAAGRAAPDAAGRAAVWADLLATCAGCHVQALPER